MRPTERALLIVLVWCSLALACAFISHLETTWLFFGALAAAVLVVDLVSVNGHHHLELVREVDTNLPIGVWSRVQVMVLSRSPAVLEVFDHMPETFETRGQPVTTRLGESQRTVFHYEIKPSTRGDAVFRGADLLLHSPWGLWKRRLFLAVEDEVRVYPNFAAVARYTLLARDDQLSLLGIRRYRRRGEGSDFLHLRDYRKGDSFRQIDWKATSKRQRMTSREYHDERDQQLVFLVDCGRRMRQLEEGQAHLDQALNAMLLLSYVASRQGDAVGFLAFAGADKWVKSHKSADMVTHILGQCYDLPSTTETADYLTVAQNLYKLQQRRALVVILSNTRNEDLDDLAQAIRLMARRHLVVLADLLEPGLKRVMTSRVTSLDRALCFHGVLDYLEARRKGHELLTHAGAICIDTNATALPSRLVNRYLDIKRAGML